MILTLGLWAVAVFLLYSGSGNRTNRWMLSPLCIITMSLLFANYDRHKKRTVTLVQAGTILLVIDLIHIQTHKLQILSAPQLKFLVCHVSIKYRLFRLGLYFNAGRHQA